MRRLVIMLALTSLGALALPHSAGALGYDLDVQLVSTSSPLTFSVEFGGPPCDAGSLVIDEVFDHDNNPVTPESVTASPSDPDRLTMVLPDDTVAGELNVSASCTNGGDAITGTGFREWGNLAVTKVVEGPAPEGATFLVRADCRSLIGASPTAFGDDAGASDVPDDFVVDLEYPATGGVGHVYTDHSTACTLTEPETGGAATVTIDPEVVDSLQDPGSFSATVTNVFAIEAEPSFTG